MHSSRKGDHAGAKPVGESAFILQCSSENVRVVQQQRRRSQKPEVGGANPSADTIFVVSFPSLSCLRGPMSRGIRLKTGKWRCKSRRRQGSPGNGTLTEPACRDRVLSGSSPGPPGDGVQVLRVPPLYFLVPFVSLTGCRRVGVAAGLQNPCPEGSIPS